VRALVRGDDRSDTVAWIGLLDGAGNLKVVMAGLLPDAIVKVDHVLVRHRDAAREISQSVQEPMELGSLDPSPITVEKTSNKASNIPSNTS
jgi:hypothetical protein